MSLNTACLLIVAALALGTLLSRVFREGLEAREVLERVPAARIGEGRTGWVRVRGKVLALRKPMTLPWNGRAAVYYEVEVSAHRMGTENVGSVRSRHVGGIDFEIDDGTGRALIRLPGGVIQAREGSKPEILTALGPSKRLRFDPPPEASVLPGELGTLLQGLEVYDVSGGYPVHAIERIIAPGDDVIVAGHATLEVDPCGSSTGFRSPPTLIVFAATDEHALVLATRRGLKSWWRA